MGKKKQRKGAPDFDDEFPESSELPSATSADPLNDTATAPKKLDKKKKSKKVSAGYLAKVYYL